MTIRLLIAFLLLPLGAFSQAAQTEPVKLPAQDTHQNLLIAADPLLSVARYKITFPKKNPYESGIVAIDVYFKNENDKPIRLNLETIRLIISPPGVDRQRLEPLAAEDVADRVLLTANANPKNRRPFPFPGSATSTGKGKAYNEMVTTLHSVALDTDVLPPHATTHGYLFFDLNHDFDAIHQSHLYIPDLSFMPGNQALFFFEIDLANTTMK